MRSKNRGEKNMRKRNGIIALIAVLIIAASICFSMASAIPKSESVKIAEMEVLPQVSERDSWVIITYSDFDNLTGWTNTTGGRGTIRVYAANSTLHLIRTGSGSDGGHATIYKDISPSVHADYLAVVIIGKINSHTLSDSGWWSERYGGFGEYPLHFEAFTGGSTVFNWGLLTRENPEGYLTNYDIVPLGQSFTWWKVVPTYGCYTTMIQLFTNGWDFNTEVDKILVAAWQQECICTKKSEAIREHHNDRRTLFFIFYAEQDINTIIWKDVLQAERLKYSMQDATQFIAWLLT